MPRKPFVNVVPACLPDRPEWVFDGGWGLIRKVTHVIWTNRWKGRPNMAETMTFCRHGVVRRNELRALPPSIYHCCHCARQAHLWEIGTHRRLFDLSDEELGARYREIPWKFDRFMAMSDLIAIERKLKVKGNS